MYLLVAFVVAALVIAIAWRGAGAPQNRSGATDDRPTSPNHPSVRGPRPNPPRRVIAPDDDPDFLREIDRRLRGEEKGN